MSAPPSPTIPSALIARLRAAHSVAVLTGAGVSAESGVRRFRDAQSGLWAKFDPLRARDPRRLSPQPANGLDWYAWRRTLMASAKPNPALRARVVGAALSAFHADHHRMWTACTRPPAAPTPSNCTAICGASNARAKVPSQTIGMTRIPTSPRGAGTAVRSCDPTCVVRGRPCRGLRWPARIRRAPLRRHARRRHLCRSPSRGGTAAACARTERAGHEVNLDSDRPLRACRVRTARTFGHRVARHWSQPCGPMTPRRAQAGFIAEGTDRPPACRSFRRGDTGTGRGSQLRCGSSAFCFNVGRRAGRAPPPDNRSSVTSWGGSGAPTANAIREYTSAQGDRIAFPST